MTMTLVRDLRPSLKVEHSIWTHNLYEVNLGENSVVVYRKFRTLGVGFHREPLITNTSLPYSSPTEEIVDHITINAGNIPHHEVTQAVKMIQEAIDEDQMNGIFNMNIDVYASRNPIMVQDSPHNGAFVVDTHEHTVHYSHEEKETDPISLTSATFSDVVALGKMVNPRFAQFPGSVYELASHAMYAYISATKNASPHDIYRLTGWTH